MHPESRLRFLKEIVLSHFIQLRLVCDTCSRLILRGLATCATNCLCRSDVGFPFFVNLGSTICNPKKKPAGLISNTWR